MLPHQHAIISVSVGALGWWWTGDPATCAVALTAGILPDMDHIADYMYYHRRGTHRLILPLHGYEYALFVIIPLKVLGMMRSGSCGPPRTSLSNCVSANLSTGFHS